MEEGWLQIADSARAAGSWLIADRALDHLDALVTQTIKVRQLVIRLVSRLLGLGTSRS